MFEYASSRSNIINWVYSQVDYRPDVLFPKKKGWEFYSRSIYPGGYQYSLFMAVVSDGNESIIFFPVDELPYTKDIPTIVNEAFRDSTIKDLGLPIHKKQLVLVISEKFESDVLGIIKKLRLKCSLLVHRYDSVSFALSGFKNPRLEYRLLRHVFDPDTVTGALISNQFLMGDRGQKLFFLQTLFHQLDLAWVTDRKKISVRKIVSASLPNWKQYRRSEQKEILKLVERELSDVFRLFFNGWATLENVSKNARSQPEAGILLPTAAKTRKNLNAWTRNQKQALNYLCHHVEPIVINVKDFMGDH